MSNEFIPTLGNLIKECDAILSSVPKSTHPSYARLFNETITEQVIFSGKGFEEAASEWARVNGWRKPS